MNNVITKQFSRLGDDIYLKRALLVFVVIVFYCGIGVYLSLAVSARLEPQYWLGLSVLFALILAAFSPENRFDVFRMPLFFWCLFFIGLTVILFLIVPTSHFQIVKNRMRIVVALTTLTWIFIMLKDQQRFLRKLVVIAVILGVIVNLISVVHTDFLLPNSNEYTNRPAGLYINPNEAATAFVFGMILSVGVVRERWRVLFVALVLLGVVATFSREAILAWLIVVALMCVLKIIKWKMMILWSCVGLVVGFVVMLVLIKTRVIAAYDAKYYNDQLSRLVWFMDGMRHDGSVDIRLKLLKHGWTVFLEHPLLGNGIGSTNFWSIPYSTHNIYLLYMVDYGIIGLFLYPLLVWCIALKSVGETRKITWCMATFMLFWGFFDHDVVRNYYSLFSISLMAAMSWISAHADAVPVQASIIPESKP